MVNTLLIRLTRLIPSKHHQIIEYLDRNEITLRSKEEWVGGDIESAEELHGVAGLSLSCAAERRSSSLHH